MKCTQIIEIYVLVRLLYVKIRCVKGDKTMNKGGNADKNVSVRSISPAITQLSAIGVGCDNAAVSPHRNRIVYYDTFLAPWLSL